MLAGAMESLDRALKYFEKSTKFENRSVMVSGSSTAPSTTAPSLTPSYSVRGVMGRRVYAERARKLGVLDLGAKRRIELGHAGPDVQELQRFLGEEGYATARDGYFGRGTKRALELWQRDAGVPTTGAFDAASKERYLRLHESMMNRAVGTGTLGGPRTGVVDGGGRRGGGGHRGGGGCASAVEDGRGWCGAVDGGASGGGPDGGGPDGGGPDGGGPDGGGPDGGATRGRGRVVLGGVEVDVLRGAGGVDGGEAAGGEGGRADWEA